MNYVDTHCHIHEASAASHGDDFVRDKWSKDGFTDPIVLADEAVGAGVTKLICVGCTLRDSELAVELAQRHPNCWASIGIHPHEAKDHKDEIAQKSFAALVEKPRVVAIGEIGLDFYYSHSDKQDQIAVLEFQLELAQRYNLPVIFHVRDAFSDFWPIFDRYEGLRGVIHSFSAGIPEVEQILSRGLYVGLNGIMTFTKSPEQLAAAKAIPLDKLLLETDAPFLTPTPYRGTICQPKHVVVTAGFLSQLRHEPLEDFAAVTTKNATTLFKFE